MHDGQSATASDLLAELVNDVYHARAPTRSSATSRALRQLAITIAANEWFASTGTLPVAEDWHGEGRWPNPEDVLELFGSWQAMLETSGLAETPLVQTLQRLAPTLAAVRAQLADADRQRRRAEQEFAEQRRRDQELLDQRIAAAEQEVLGQLAVRDAQVRAAEEVCADVEAAARRAVQDLSDERERVSQLRGALEAAEAQVREAQERSLTLAARVTSEFVGTAPAFRAWTGFDDSTFSARLSSLAAAFLGGRLRSEIVGAAIGLTQLFDGQDLVTVRRLESTDAACIELVHVAPLAERPGALQTVGVVLWRERDRGGVLTEVRSLGGDAEVDDARLGDLAVAQTQVGELTPDAGWPLQTGPRTVGPEDFERFARFLADPRRCRPVLVLTSQAEAGPAGDPNKLACSLCGAAHVVVLTKPAASAMTGQFGEGLSVWNGAVRCYAPGFNEQSSGTEHPFLTRSTLAELDPAEITRDLILLASASLPAPPALLRAADAAGMPRAVVPCLREHESGERPPAAEPYAGRIARLTTELEQARRGLEAFEHISAQLEEQEPKSVLEAAERAAAETQHLRFASSAFVSAAESPFRRPREVYASLMLLDQLAGDFEQGELGERLSDRAAVLGLDYRSGVSRTSRVRAAEEYSFTYEGQTLRLGPHLAIGGGGGPLRNVRVYMYRADGKDEGLPRGLIIGHIGLHLPAKSGKE